MCQVVAANEVPSPCKFASVFTNTQTFPFATIANVWYIANNMVTSVGATPIGSLVVVSPPIGVVINPNGVVLFNPVFNIAPVFPQA